MRTILLATAAVLAMSPIALAQNTPDTQPSAAAQQTATQTQQKDTQQLGRSQKHAAESRLHRYPTCAYFVRGPRERYEWKLSRHVDQPGIVY